jgi:hypothetical protein
LNGFREPKIVPCRVRHHFLVPITMPYSVRGHLREPGRCLQSGAECEDSPRCFRQSQWP